MPEQPEKDTSADRTPATHSVAGSPVPLGKGDEEEPFPYCLQIGDVYDGPFDLLLDLVKTQGLDINDLPIANITAQFLAYSRTIPPEETERAIEFVRIAAWLIFIKSRMLLPIERPIDGTETEDPRKSLVERLLEYEQVKQAAKVLNDLQWTEAARLSNPGGREFRDEPNEPEPCPTEPADSTDLGKKYREIMERADVGEITIDREPVTVAFMFDVLRGYLRKTKVPVSFEEAIGGSRSPRVITATFLAALELVRLGAVFIKQDQECGTILIKKSPAFDEAVNKTVSFDE